MTIYQKTVLGALVSAALAAAVGLFAIHEVKSVLLDRIGEASGQLAAETMDKIDRTIHGRIEVIQEYSRDQAMQRFVKEASRQLDERTDRAAYIQQQDGDWRAAPPDTVTPFMRDIIDNDLSDLLRRKAQFYEKEYGATVFGELFITDKHGVNVAQTGKTTDYYQADEAWWQASRQNGRHIGEATYDESAKMLSIDIGIRIDDDEGEFVGIIKAILDIGDVNNVIKNLGPTHSHMEEDVTVPGYALVTRDGALLYSTTDPDTDRRNIAPELMKRLYPTEHEACYFLTPGSGPGEAEMLFAHAHSKGHSDYPGLGWMLIVQYKTGELFAPIARLRNWIGFVTAVAVLLAVFVGLLISSTISGRLERLGEASAGIAEGDLDVRVDIGPNDELGRLAESFNEMAEKLSIAMRREKTLAEAEKQKADKLRAANQQLRASEQQLLANEQQLRASEQQLRAANQLLKTKEQTLLASQEDLADKVFELERFNRLMIGRELEMARLKQEVNVLLETAGQSRKYAG